METLAVREAAAAGLQSLSNLIGLLSTHSHRQPPYSAATDYIAVTDNAVTNFKKFISLLDRTSTGHARFRRGPVSNPPATLQKIPATKQEMPKMGAFDKKNIPAITISFSGAGAASPATSFLSSLTGETEGLQLSMSSGFQITNMSSSSSFKRKCNSVDDSHNKCAGSSGRCHCSKKRKSRLKRVVRVPAVSVKTADIPPDDYSWRKYGQKPIKGSPYPSTTKTTILSSSSSVLHILHSPSQSINQTTYHYHILLSPSPSFPPPQPTLISPIHHSQIPRRYSPSRGHRRGHTTLFPQKKSKGRRDERKIGRSFDSSSLLSSNYTTRCWGTSWTIGMPR